jgi:hypothetical protein
VEPGITVIDICDAPLGINRWYAQRQHARIATEACSIFDYRPAAAIDVVATDHFLCLFPAELTDRVVAAWHTMLVRGGKVITAQGLAAGARRDSAEKQLDRLARLTDDVIEALGTDRATLESYIREFPAGRNRHEFRDVAEVEQLFQRHGFSVELLGEVPEGFDLDDPGRSSKPRRMFFEATKA